MTRSEIIAAIQAEAQAQGVDPSLALSVAAAESNLNPEAIGAEGEIGLFQLMPATAARLGVDASDIGQSISGGIHYLAQLLAQFGGDQALAVAAYNAGPGRVANALARYGTNWQKGIPDSTRTYVAQVLGTVPSLSAASPSAESSPVRSALVQAPSAKPLGGAALAVAALAVLAFAALT